MIPKDAEKPVDVATLYARDGGEDFRPAEHPAPGLGRPGQDRPVPQRQQGDGQAGNPFCPAGRGRGDGESHRPGGGGRQGPAARHRGGAPAGGKGGL